MEENRPRLDDPVVLEALAHPVRMDVLGFLMSAGPATASACARAVGDTPSNCSYHLRILAKHGLVVKDASPDGRERPWRATITGYTTDPDPSGDHPDRTAAITQMVGASLQLEHQLAREHLRARDGLAPEWRDIDALLSYGLKVTPEELKAIVERIDAIVRPYIAATREDSGDDAAYAHLAVTAFPRAHFG